MKISAIVAAYNEGPRIGPVLEVLTTYPGFHEVIVSDDGSTDSTGTVASQYPVKYLKSEKNQGKGAAVERAVATAEGDLLFFCDADVQELTHDIIRELIEPVQRGDKEMATAMRYHPILEVFPWLIKFILQLGGERALTKRLWQMMPVHYKYQFRVEVGLNYYATHHGKGFVYGYYPALRQPTKDKKRGFWAGNWQRIKMAAQILAASLRLRLIG
jgi:glycosyltransferase involved in cell wall biosynthesis